MFNLCDVGLTRTTSVRARLKKYWVVLLCTLMTLFHVSGANADQPKIDINSSDEVSALISADSLERIRNIQKQFEQVKGKPKPDGYSHCRWNDPEATKEQLPFFLSEYERAILSCTEQWAPHTQTVWIGLHEAKNSIHANDYDAALEFLRSSRYQESAQNSAVRALTDKVIDLFEGGASKAFTMHESYFACVEWAELDPKQIMNGREYKVLSKAELAISKGLLVCD